jgi:hypothetical protein
MEIREDPNTGVFVEDIVLKEVKSISDMQQLMELGFSHRAVRATNMNTESSRSHSIFTLSIESQ